MVFPNAKINLGLSVGATRHDGYHDIVTVMVPVSWTDVLEIVPSAKGETSLTLSGNTVECPPEKNLVMKAYRRFAELHNIPEVDIYLRKIIPDGAGMGGGSADAAFTLRLLRDMFAPDVDNDELAEMASGIGADCPFFIHNKPQLATGTGTTLSAIDLPMLRGYKVLVVKPQGSVSTAEAYKYVEPTYRSAESLMEVLSRPVDEWQGTLTNDFEPVVCRGMPQVAELIEWLKGEGACYAAMSGSGSAVFGIFKADKMAGESLIPPVDGCAIKLCDIGI